MRAFLVVCLLSAVCLVNARRLASQGSATGRARGRFYAGAENVGPTGHAGVTYSIGGNAGAKIGARFGTGLEGTGFEGQWGNLGGIYGPWSSYYPGGSAGYYPGFNGWYGGNNGWGPNYGSNGWYAAPWSSLYPYGGGYGNVNGYGANFGNWGWNFRRGGSSRAAGPAFAVAGPSASPAAAGAASATPNVASSSASSS